MNQQRDAARQAIEYLHWEIRADELLARLFSSPNRHTRRLYAADVEHFRSWLQTRYHEAESLPLMLAILSSTGRSTPPPWPAAIETICSPSAIAPGL
jgi:hypothetical protein